MSNEAKKIIRKSQRGLTFSFPSQGRLTIGSRYDYVIDNSENMSIRIVPADQGKYTLSRKRSGAKWYSLVDLRNSEVRDAIKAMNKICVHFDGSEIVVRDAGAKAEAVLRFPRAALASVRMAVGLDDTAAADALLRGAQITMDEYLASISASPASIPTIQKDLSDVYTLASLFSGAGILDWPFAKDPRFDIRYAIDYDAAACKTYRHNIGTHIVHGDVHKAFTESGYPLDQTVGSVDIVLGGPSCKPFSNANRHTRLENHPDSDLVVQYMRIVKKLRPRVFAMENVPAVLTASGGAYYDAIKEAALACGYKVESRIVQDNKVGGFTTRRRAVILGSRVGPISFCELALACGQKTAGDALRAVDENWANYSDVTLPGEETRRRMQFVPQGGNYTSIPEVFRTKGKNRHSSTYRRLSLTEPAPTIVNWRKPPLIHPTKNRTLTVAEAKALQGLPGGYRIFGTLGQMQQQVGNSVPVAIGRYIKNAILSTLAQAIRPRSAPAFT